MNLLSTIGLTASLIGCAANVVGDYVSKKQMEELIEEKVEEKFAAMMNEEEKEEV